MSEALTNLDARELEDFFRLLPMIYCDYRSPASGKFGMVYLYSQTKDNADSIFLRAIELAKAGKMRSLGVAEGDLGHGYEGFDASVARLYELGWDDGFGVRIQKLNVHGNVNTGSEAKLLAEHASLESDIGIVAPQFHLVRAFMTSVTALRGKYARIYAIPGVTMSWSEEVAHSQGVVRGTRAGLLVSELKRLEQYRAPEYGSMLGATEIIDYLDWRDNRR